MLVVSYTRVQTAEGTSIGQPALVFSVRKLACVTWTLVMRLLSSMQEVIVISQSCCGNLNSKETRGSCFGCY